MSVTNITSTKHFEGTLTSASARQVIAVHWTAKWCGPCKRITPDFDNLAKAYPRTKFLRVDVDENKELAQKATVSKLPTFTFYNGSTLLSKETLQGPSASKLKEVVGRLDKATNPFAGGGYSLSSSGPSTASSSGAAAGAAAGGSSAQAAKPKRFNPWAQKNFVPPAMRAAKEAEKAAAATSDASAKSKKDPPARQSPWSDPNFKPKTASDAPPTKPEPPAAASSSAEDDELARALKMSMEESSPTTAAAAGGGADGDKMVDDQSTSASGTQEGNDPSLLKGVNQDFLKQLQDMGFGKVRSEKALILTKSKNLEAAMNWLVENESAPDIDEPLKVVGAAASSSSAAKAWKPNERGAPLGWKPGDAYEDDDVDDNVLKSLKKNNKYKSTQQDAKKPMTKEEKLKDLEERRARRKDDIIKDELAKQKSSHKSRVETTKAMAKLKSDRAELEQKRAAERTKREKERAAARRKKVLEKTRLEKQRRKKEADERKKRLEELKAAKEAGKA